MSRGADPAVDGADPIGVWLAGARGNVATMSRKTAIARADDHGDGGLQPRLASFFEVPIGVDEHVFSRQLDRLYDYAERHRCCRTIPTDCRSIPTRP